MHVPTMAEMTAKGESPEVLFWVGCAGSFDQRAQKITKAFVTILDKVGINYAILGKEELCTGDPARRAGNETHMDVNHPCARMQLVAYSFTPENRSAKRLRSSSLRTLRVMP